MGRQFEAGFTGNAAASGAAYAAFEVGANVRGRVREIGLFISAATTTPIITNRVT